LCSKPGMNSARRKRWATEILSILSEDYGFNIPRNFNNQDLLKCINSVPRISENGVLTLENAIDMLFNLLTFDWKSNEEITKTYSDFFAKIENRIETYELCNTIEAFEKCFNERHGVVISTCHGVKGEEYKTVIAFGLLNGYLPNWNVIIHGSNGERKNEADRLLFVISSRAKENLYLFSEQGHFTRRGDPYQPNDEINAICYKYDL